MKRLIYIFAALFALTSCTIYEADEPNPDRYARKAYKLMNEQITFQLHVLSYAQVINQYAQADETERYAIEDKHLPRLRLRQTDDGWRVMDGDDTALYVIFDTPLDEVGSIWKIKQGDGAVSHKYWEIECKGENLWQIRYASDFYNYSVSLLLDVEAGELTEGRLCDTPIYEYTTTGEGCIDQNVEVASPYRTEMEIVEPVRSDRYIYTSYYGDQVARYSFMEGLLSFKVTNTKADGSDASTFLCKITGPQQQKFIHNPK